MAHSSSTVVSEDDIQATYTNDKFGNSVVFASDLGWKLGFWPAEFITLKSRVRFLLDTEMFRGDDEVETELVSRTYRSREDGVIVVLND